MFEVAVGADSLPYDDRVLNNLICLRNLNRFAAFTTGDEHGLPFNLPAHG